MEEEILTYQQNTLLGFIHKCQSERGVSPSFDEMRDCLGLQSKSGIHRLLNALEERGFIRRLKNRARAIEILRLPDFLHEVEKDRAAFDHNLQQKQTLSATLPDRGENVITLNRNGGTGKPGTHKSPTAGEAYEIPFYGRIAAGQPIEAVAAPEMLEIPSAMVGAGDHYALEVTGDSMCNLGIFDGDYAIIKKSDTSPNNRIIVALIDDTEATLKTLKREDGKIFLIPANEAYETQVYEPEQVRIQGILAGIMRQYQV